jgi:hypothetical protein
MVHYARLEELFQIHMALANVNDGRTAVLHGLGGMGKTQLALAYTKYYAADFSDIFWLHLGDEDSAKRSYVRIAEQILNGRHLATQLNAITADSKVDETIEAVRQWLHESRNTQWLMICDNYDHPKPAENAVQAVVDMGRFLPAIGHGSIIITTRSSAVEIGHRVRVGKLKNIRDSLQILSEASHREGVIDGKNCIGIRMQANYSSDPAAAELAKELDGLPLALDLAGAYLKQATISFKDYLRMYKAP